MIDFDEDYAKIAICEIIAEHGKISFIDILKELEKKGLLDLDDINLQDFSFSPDTVFCPGENWGKAPRLN